MAKIRKSPQAWWGKAFTLQGRILIAKTIGVPQLIYPLMNIEISQEDIKELQAILKNYIWLGNKVPNVGKMVFMQDYIYGGLKAPECTIIQKAMQLTWINRIWEGENAPWKAILAEALEPFGGYDY